MTDEIYKQSRKPTNPLENFDPGDVETVMKKIKEAEKTAVKMDPITRQPINKDVGDLPFQVEGSMPPEVAALFKKDSQAQKQKQTQQAQIDKQNEQVRPKLVYTDNPKLQELLEGCKPKTGQYEEVHLPSLGKFYKDGECPRDGLIHVRPMTGQEEEILATPRFLKKGVAVQMIFKNCVQENINPDKWLTIDRTHLLIYLRGISYGPIYDVEIKCPHCSHRFQSQIDLDSLFVNYCPQEYNLDNLKGELPVTKYKFNFRLPTVADETMIANYREKRQKELGQADVTDDTFTWRAALLLEDIEGLNDHASLMTLISRLPIADVAHLRNTLNDIPFGVDTKIAQWCQSCGEDFDIDLPIEVGFFFPQPKKVSRTRASN